MKTQRGRKTDRKTIIHMLLQLMSCHYPHPQPDTFAENKIRICWFESSSVVTYQRNCSGLSYEHDPPYLPFNTPGGLVCLGGCWAIAPAITQNTTSSVSTCRSRVSGRHSTCYRPFDCKTRYTRHLHFYAFSFTSSIVYDSI